MSRRVLTGNRKVDFYAHAGQAASDQHPLIIFEDQRDNLRVYAGSDIRNAISMSELEYLIFKSRERVLIYVTDHRQHIRLILEFQHQKDKSHEYHGTYRISFASMNLHFPVSLAKCYIGLNGRNGRCEILLCENLAKCKLTEMKRMQQLLLRQKVSRRYLYSTEF